MPDEEASREIALTWVLGGLMDARWTELPIPARAICGQGTTSVLLAGWPRPAAHTRRRRGRQRPRQTAQRGSVPAHSADRIETVRNRSCPTLRPEPSDGSHPGPGSLGLRPWPTAPAPEAAAAVLVHALAETLRPSVAAQSRTPASTSRASLRDKRRGRQRSHLCRSEALFGCSSTRFHPLGAGCRPSHQHLRSPSTGEPWRRLRVVDRCV